MKRLLLLPLACLSLIATAQKKADKKTATSLQAHINYLASDKLEGRRTGTAGEKLAAAYISAQMKQAGITPGEGNDYLQEFTVREGKEAGPGTKLTINNKQFTSKQFTPLPFSANKSASGEVLPGVNEPDNVWMLDVKELEGMESPHADAAAVYLAAAKEAEKNKAKGVIFFNGKETQGAVAKWLSSQHTALNIPVLWAGAEASKVLADQNANDFQISMAVDLQQTKRTGTNVIGYINNNAPTTIIIGAHYDHLGYGEDENSLGAGEKAIHNGADDNASGTAALLELGRQLKASKNKKSNYLLIAFSGEELGLFGSKYYTQNHTLDFKKVNFMINMDMVGRLDNNKGLQIGGIGTSPSWGSILKASLPKELKVTYDSSGTGPSDHTSFYRSDLPVLFLFTGTHSDYHKPTDDADKINIDGEVQIVKLVYDIIENSTKQDKLMFTKTKEMQMGTSPRFSVTLGIMPDYTFSGGGVRADGVSEGKPAKKAGLQAGDVIVQLGNSKIADLEAYMAALATFKAGDKTTVKVKRGATEKTFDITF
ncbi:M20/M25/M40 family metallo-hydrolase [Chitinophaga horti]|uniref:M20/M25/M40 family metallo-hydrolase n=1 Tax=Chitinophaga horti TaxID=2920382 RepID=A0ABY6J377_9BACT|nr:M20/M25/M40 family metallo-hydrolase [Chitinophaga horti]UYQ92759.1 M20/M25/M40 family metallo-hydrolase [Chitinophaga horti]